METRSMKRKAAAAALAVPPPQPQAHQPECVLEVADRACTPPNEIDPFSLYYDIFTPNQKVRHRLSKVSQRLDRSFEDSSIYHVVEVPDDGEETPKNGWSPAPSPKASSFLTPLDDCLSQGC